MVYDVFLSYRRSDGLKIAEMLYRFLTGKGLRVFFDKEEMDTGILTSRFTVRLSVRRTIFFWGPRTLFDSGKVYLVMFGKRFAWRFASMIGIRKIGWFFPSCP